MPDRRYRLDSDATLFGRVLVGGSPLRLFRLTDAGQRVVDQIADPTPDSRLPESRLPESRLIDALLDAGAIHPVAEAGGEYSDTDVTVVVPAFGAVAHSPAGAIIVDDGSTPPISNATIRIERNAGPAAARNTGLERVTTRLVAFVDADVELPDGWLDALLPHFDDDRVGLVAPRVRSRLGSSRLERYEHAESPLDLGDRPARVRAGSRVPYVPAAALVCRVDALTDVGGFDETLRFGEDVDLVWRLDEAGWRVRYEPLTTVTHEPRSGWRDWFRQRVGYGSSAAALARRHPGALAPLRMSGWSLGAWGVGVGVNPIAGVAIAAGSAVALVRRLPDLPPREAFRLAWFGNVHAGGQIAAAVRRVWWPIVVVAAVRSRFARRTLLLSVMAARHPVKVVDDVAYSVGVWRGVLAEGTIDPIVPTISSWPGRGSPERPEAGR